MRERRKAAESKESDLQEEEEDFSSYFTRIKPAFGSDRERLFAGRGRGDGRAGRGCESGEKRGKVVGKDGIVLLDTTYIPKIRERKV